MALAFQVCAWSPGFPMLWFPYGCTMVFLWLPIVFPLVSYCFSTVFLWFPMVILSYGFLSGHVFARMSVYTDTGRGAATSLLGNRFVRIHSDMLVHSARVFVLLWGGCRPPTPPRLGIGWYLNVYPLCLRGFRSAGVRSSKRTCYERAFSFHTTSLVSSMVPQSYSNVSFISMALAFQVCAWSPGFPMVFRWFSFGFLWFSYWFCFGFPPTVFLRCSYGFLWLSFGVPWRSYGFPSGFPIVFLRFSYGFLWLSFGLLWFYGFLMVFLRCSYGLPVVFAMVFAMVFLWLSFGVPWRSYGFL